MDETMGMGLYFAIWKSHLGKIVDAVKNGNGAILVLEKSLSSEGGCRESYGFCLQIDGGVVPSKSGSAVARDLKAVLDGCVEFKKIAKSKSITMTFRKEHEGIYKLRILSNTEEGHGAQND